jgi:hypothetical protein
MASSIPEIWPVTSDEHLFHRWFSNILQELETGYPQDAGAALLMISFPLLDSYVRKKCRIKDGRLRGKDVDTFFAYLCHDDLFPELRDGKAASKFWGVFRDGLLHLARLKGTTDNWRVDDSSAAVEVNRKADGSVRNFTVNPVKFARRVREKIVSDLAGFLNGPHLGVTADGTCTIKTPRMPEYQDGFK